MVESIAAPIAARIEQADDYTIGPVVRINPNELHFADFEFYDTIYASAPQKRDKWGYNAKVLDSHYATGFTLDHDYHKARRDAVAPSLSKRNIQVVEPEIQKRVDRICRLIEEHHDSNKPINLTIIILALSRLTSTLSITQTDF